MADYTYYLYDAAPNTAPNFTTWGAIRTDFASNNRMGAGTGVIGSGVLYIKVRGNVTGGGNFNFVAAAGISVGSGGSCIIEADTNPFDASSSNALGFSASFDSVTFGGDEGINTDLTGVTIRRLMLRGSLSGAGHIVVNVQNSASMTFAIEDCVIEQTLNNASGVVRLSSTASMRNTIVLQKSTHASAYAVDINLRHSVNPTIEQCVIVGNSANSVGVTDKDGSGATLTNVKNTYCGGPTTPFGGLSAGSATGLASSTTGTPGTSAINSVALSTTNFVNVTGSGDWTVKSTSTLKTTGAVRLGSVLSDVFGQSRSATTTIGANAAEAAAAGAKGAIHFYRAAAHQ